MSVFSLSQSLNFEKKKTSSSTPLNTSSQLQRDVRFVALYLEEKNLEIDWEALIVGHVL
jgi:hypothetical protein